MGSSSKTNGSSASSSADGRIGGDPSSVRALLRSINQPQSLGTNLAHLRSSTIGDAAGLLALLASDAGGGGIATASAEERRRIYGTNYTPSAPRRSLFQLLVDTFDDATVQILMAAAVVSLAVGIYDDPATGYIEGVAILAAVLIVAVVTALNDYEKERQFESLSEENDNVDAVVLRDGGTSRQISVRDIVVGDVVCVEAGDQIPCDGVLLSCDGLELDESALTGEPDDVDKDLTHDPFVLSGCTASAGAGTYVATAVGRDSQWGVIKAHLEKEQEQTPLQEKLDAMAALIGYVGIAAALATFGAMLVLKLAVRPAYLDDVSVFHFALDAFIIGVTIVVVAVPEGLPLAVTISLAYSTKKMLADQNLIRHLHACETMGNATNICSDKTGTLTQNRMTVVRGWFANTVRTTVPDDGAANDLTAAASADIAPAALEIILQGIATCSTARIVPAEIAHKDDDPDGLIHDPRPVLIGNKTEAALLALAVSPFGNGDDYAARRAAAQFGKSGGSRLFPFSSVRKRMSVIVNEPVGGASSAGSAATGTPGRRRLRSKNGNGNGGAGVPTTGDGRMRWTLYHKGAAESVLQNCSTYLDADGSARKLTAAKRSEIEATIKDYATSALRCVALCHRYDVDSAVDVSRCTVGECAEKLEKDMCLDALVGIADPLRPDVIEAVATCQKAGIFVRMVTGDNLDTAMAIAKEAGILHDDGISMVGEDFRKLTPAQLDDVLPRLQVLARSSPEDKHMLVQRLNGGLMPTTEEQWLEVHPGKDYATQKDKLLPGHMDEWALSRRGGVGEVVGVTGDGTNDGPALKAADVGLSMGISGTDVAKNASDIVIMDDNFSSIVKAVLWGRSVFDNIRKFLQFQLTVNVVALTITFLSAVCGYKPPLNAVMMLWVNLIMDTMGALALGTEPPTTELLDRRPYKRDASLINRPMWRNILVQATYQLGLLVFLLKEAPVMFGCGDGTRHHFTIIFNAFVFCQVFNEFNAREIGDVFDPFKKLGTSPMFVVVIVFTIIAQWFIVEYGGDFTQTYPLSFEEWEITFMLGAMSIPVGYLMRLIPIDEDPESFAGIGDSMPKKKPTSPVGMLSLLIPLAAGLYQFYKEADGEGLI